MNILRTIWRASLRSSSNAIHRDARSRLALILSLVVQLTLGVWGILRLLPVLSTWQAAGTLALQQHLWLTWLLAWLLIALFAALATYQYGLASDEALLLLIQPLSPATRLRALYGQVFLRGIASWLIFEVASAGTALVLALGWTALPWLLLLIAGASLVAWLALIATLLFLRLIVPYLRQILELIASAVVLLTLLSLIIHLTPRSISFALPTVDFSPPPLIAFVCCLICLLLAMFPLASSTGQLYLSVFLRGQGRATASRPLSPPGLRLLLILLSRSRTLTAALLGKGLLNQGRNVFAWARLLVLLIGFILFPRVRSALAPWHLSPILQVAGYASLLAVLLLIEYAPYAISSEGNRLALYLTMPRGISPFLRARLASFLVPALLTGLMGALLFGLECDLSLPTLIAPLVLVLLILTAYIAFTVLGSALDEDLNVAIEDRAQALIQEELPISPRRLQLLGLSFMLFAAQLYLAWRLPLPLALSALALLDGGVILLLWHISQSYLNRLLR
jgi:hypothetical protein